MQLSSNFSLEELVRSEVAARNGLKNEPTPYATANLVMLCWHILEPLRVKLGKPILVNSGYRSPALNALVRGAEDSLHRSGRAADIVVPGVAPVEVCRTIQAMKLPYSELIHEFGQWTHVAVGEVGKEADRASFTATRAADGRVEYRKGIA